MPQFEVGFAIRRAIISKVWLRDLQNWQLQSVSVRSLMKALSAAVFAAALAAAQMPGTKTGPDVGQKIPAFEARDQNGKEQTLATLRGPKGLVLLFVRSADW